MTTRSIYDQRALTTDEVERDERLARIARVFTKIDRVLVGEKVNVRLAESGPAPAWSDGETITLNKQEIDNLDIAAMVQIHGLNFHEVSHVLYTPRFGTMLTQWVVDRRLMPAYNMLEDQRIETLMVGRHPSVAPYLSAVILRWLADSPQKIAGNYILVRGRRYLDVKVRSAFRSAFSAPELIPAIERIVDEYRLLVFPRDYDRAKALIVEFQREVLDRMPTPPSSGCQAGSKTTQGRPVPQKEQDTDSKKAKGQKAKDEKNEKDAKPAKDKAEAKDADKGEEAEGEDEGKGGESDESEDEGDESGSGEGEGTEEGEDGESESEGGDEDGEGEGEGEGDSESDSDSDGESGEGAGNGTGQSEGLTDEEGDAGEGAGGSGAGAGSGEQSGPVDVESVLAEALDDITNSADVQTEMNARRKAIQKGSPDGWFETHLPRGRFNGSKASAHLAASERKFRDVLRRLVEDCDPGWDRETPSGRLNIRRAMAGADPSEAFDRWAEGNEGADLEVFIAADNSGSMVRMVGGMMGSTAASETLWVLAKALKGVGADVTAVTFGDCQEVVYGREDTVVKDVMDITRHGGTAALPALEEAERLMRSSRRKNRLVIMITDGAWSHADACDETMRRIESLGVLTAVAFVNTGGSNYAPDQAFTRFGHGAQVFGSVSKPSDLAGWGKALVSATIKRFGPAVR